MWPWYGFWHPWGWSGYRMPYWYLYGGYGYGYPWGAMPKEEEVAMLEEQEKYLTSELDGVRKRLEELRK
ncbi:MAG: DUF5320 domain-containing protein [Dehalococcoidia bacterium]|nr:DUF5320 domain-containing protein [Dehalococcoidia bacterium]